MNISSELNTIMNILNTLMESNKTVFQDLNVFSNELKNIKTEVVKITENADVDENTNITGTVYTRWGRTTCPGNESAVYSGYTASSDPGLFGGGSFVCLPQDPEWNRYDNETIFFHMFGTEYYSDELFNHNHRYNDVPCAVCIVNTRSTTIVIPGRRTCYPDWTAEYSGYLMSDHSSAELLCIDEQPEDLPDGEASEQPVQLMFISMYCGTTTYCPPFVEDRQLTCVVCTK